MAPRTSPRLAFWLLLTAVVAQNTTDNLKYVDQLIGSANGGNVFAGATLPYGMAKAVADVDSGSNQGGFTSEGGRVTGFSTMHDSGTGGSPSLGSFAFFPSAPCPGDDVNRCVFPKVRRALHYREDSVKASPGYFGIALENGIAAEMTTSQHTSLFRFKFPAESANGTSPLILLDLTDLANTRQDNATISLDGDSGRMTGSARFNPSFGVGTWVGYFCADFSGAGIRDNGIWVNSRADASVKDLKFNRGINGGGPLPGGGFVRFNTNPSDGVLARIGVSLISSAQACSSAEAEIPTFDFAATKTAAETAWREKLSPISLTTTGVDTSLVTNFFSGIYRTMVNPQNYTGENPLWSSSEPYFDSFYCLWDSFRSQLPFLTILDPVALQQMVRSLIDTYEHEGWLPDCRMSLCKGYTQGGSNADVVLADAYIKGLDDGIDWEKGYAAVVKDAEVEPYLWSVEGRGGLDSWETLGYIPTEDFDYKGFGTVTRSVSRTLEYAYNDFCIAQMADGLGKSADREKYLERSSNWKNLFYAEQESKLFNGTDTGFKGFFQGRYANGTWHTQDPLWCSAIDPDNSRVCSLQNNGQETFESSLWEYGFYVPHAQTSLISLYGGPQNFVSRLNYLHDRNITYIGNEPSFLTVYQYHWAGRPGLSAERVHFYIPRFFSTARDGLPGNDDSGAMGSFVAFSMMGLFPTPGQNVYLLTPPFFPSVSLTSPLTNATATIRVANFDPAYRALYIQSATLDGVNYTKSWIGHEFFTKGGELVVTVGERESGWGTGAGDLPPSLGEGGAGNRTGLLGTRGWEMRMGV